jgi:hypothetical protein
MITPAGAIADPNLLAPYFAGDSWDLWRAVLKATYGEPLSSHELALFTEVAERGPPKRRVRELWAVISRRGGKDSVASACATAAAMGDYSGLLRPGEKATVMLLACDRQQAKIVFRYIAGYFAEVPLLRPLVAREVDDTIELTNGVEIVVATNNYRAVRGRSVVCCIFDEVAFWRDEASATPDIATYDAVIPSLATFPNALLIGISSPYRRSGLLFEKWKAHYGKPDDDVLVVRGPSRKFNPTLPQSVIDAAIARDPEAASAEWLAEWRTDLADFVSRAVVDACIEPGCHERPYVSAAGPYFCFVDAAGGSGSDSMTLAISHADKERGAVLDVLREVRPPFSPDAVVLEFSAVMKSYRVMQAESDRWGGDWVGEAFRKQNIRVVPSAKPKADLYREALPLLNAHRCSLLDHPRLVSQLCGLERRTACGGRDSIDHAPGGHGDLANAASGALLLVTTGRQPMRISDEAMARFASPPPYRGVFL